MSPRSSSGRGTGRAHAKGTAPADRTVAPGKGEVKVMGEKRDLTHTLIKVTVDNTTLSLRIFNFTCTYHPEQLRDLFLKLYPLGNINDDCILDPKVSLSLHIPVYTE